jgi:phosphate-selective porin OprO/OprP
MAKMDDCVYRRGNSVAAASWLLPALLLASQADAQTSTEKLDELWSHARLHSGDSDAAVQSVVFTGRFQYDFAYVDSGDEDYSDTDTRRWRMGFKVSFKHDLVFHAEAEYHPSLDPVYQRLTDTYIAWNPSAAVELTVGKQGANFTMDGMTSSKELIAVDRSALTNNIWFTEEYIPGVTVTGEVGKLSYNAGYFTSGSINRGFGDSDGGEFFLGTVGHDFSERFDAKAAQLNFNYVDNEPDPANGFTRPLEQIISVNFAFEKERWGVRSDISAATGYLGQSDLSGFMVMPFYNLRNSNQLVWRYTYVDSKDPNGVRFGRYERELESGRGDRYSEIYFGVNHYWYGHKLKIQSGIQYVDMSDAANDGGAFTGWSWTTGFRISW